MLHETSNDIELRYQAATLTEAYYTGGASATVGIQADTSSYLEYSCETAALHDGLVILFTTCPEPLGDMDGDGLDGCLDCDDGDSSVYPGAEDTCDDGVDSDCLGDLEDTEVDSDGDGISECGGDCDDTDPAVHPGADDLCNGIDDDCNGIVDEDGDGDGWTLCAGDCDDADPGRFPGAAEVCDELDNDCDDDVDLHGTAPPVRRSPTSRPPASCRRSCRPLGGIAAGLPAGRRVGHCLTPNPKGITFLESSTGGCPGWVQCPRSP